MPGKQPDGSSYSYISALALLREVTVADTNTQVGIAAISEQVDLSAANGDNISIGSNNALTLGVLLPVGVSAATVKVFVNMKGDLSVSNQWAEAHTQDILGSAHISLKDIYPANVKVAITSMTGAGTIQITYGRSL